MMNILALIFPRRHRIKALQKEREALARRIYHKRLRHEEWKPLEAKLRELTHIQLRLEL